MRGDFARHSAGRGITRGWIKKRFGLLRRGMVNTGMVNADSGNIFRLPTFCEILAVFGRICDFRSG